MHNVTLGFLSERTLLSKTSKSLKHCKITRRLNELNYARPRNLVAKASVRVPRLYLSSTPTNLTQPTLCEKLKTLQNIKTAKLCGGKMPVFCVTGGTGYIAAHLVKSLLEKGHIVRATVRDPEDLGKVGFLWELKGAKDRLNLVKADLLEEGSFDDAVNGVDGVFHTAARVVPPPYGDDVHQILIDPAVKGTVNVLKSCVKARVHRVVLTSSSSTTRYRQDVQQVSPLNESHWSDLDYCIRHKMWYAFAKTSAEKEAWKIAKETGLDLVVVLPSFVVGPMLPPHPTSSLLLLHHIIKGTKGGIPNQIIGFVHIDDVVSAHILAMEESKASGRLICTGPVVHWTEIVEMLKAKYPIYPYENRVITILEGDANSHSYDTSKIVELGLPGFKTIHQMFDDCIKSFQDQGYL